MGAEILASLRSRPDDMPRGAAKSEQSGVDPPGTEKRAKDFADRPDRIFLGLTAEVDFPAFGSKDSVGRAPSFRETGEQPEADRLVSVLGGDSQPEPGVG